MEVSFEIQDYTLNCHLKIVTLVSRTTEGFIREHDRRSQFVRSSSQDERQALRHKLLCISTVQHCALKT